MLGETCLRVGVLANPLKGLIGSLRHRWKYLVSHPLGLFEIGHEIFHFDLQLVQLGLKFVSLLRVL